jgi:hypothetical protein
MHLFALPIGTRYAVSDTLTLADCDAWFNFHGVFFVSEWFRNGWSIPHRIHVWRKMGGFPWDFNIFQQR